MEELLVRTLMAWCLIVVVRHHPLIQIVREGVEELWTKCGR